MEENNQNLNDLNHTEVILEPASVENPTGVDASAELPIEAMAVPEPAPMPIPEEAAPMPMPTPMPMPEELVAPAPSPMNGEVAETSTKPKKKVGLIVAIVLILLLIAGIAGFIFYAGTKIIFEKNIDRMMAKFYIEEVYDKPFNKGELKATTVIDTTASNVLPKFKYDLVTDFNIDLDKKIVNIVYSLASESNKIDGEFITNEKSSFVKFNFIDNKLFDLGEAMIDFAEMNNSQFTVKDYNKVVKYFNRAINVNVHNNDLKTEKAKINVGGKDYNSKKIIYEITPEEAKSIVTTFLNNVKKDKNLVKALFGDLDKGNKTLDESIENVKNNDFKKESTIQYIVYMDGLKGLRHEVLAAEGSKIVFDMYNEAKNSVEKLSVYYHEQKQVEMIITKTATDKYNLDIDVAGSFKINGTYNEGKDSSALDLKVAMQGQEFATIKLTSNGRGDKSDGTLEIASAALGINISSKVSADLTKTAKAIDTSGAVPYSSMSEEEQQMLSTVMMTVLGPIMASSNALSGSY